MDVECGFCYFGGDRISLNACVFPSYQQVHKWRPEASCKFGL